MKTQEEINHLISQWVRDPIWELETTEGFEEHREELRQVELDYYMKWNLESKRKHDEFVESCLKMTNVELMYEIMKLKHRIEELENHIFKEG